MKWWWLNAVLLLGGMWVCWWAAGVGIDLSAKAKAADYAEQTGLREKCVAARVLFFEECLLTDPRPRCEVMWAQTRGKVFDSAPDKLWAEELDCSEVR